MYTVIFRGIVGNTEAPITFTAGVWVAFFANSSLTNWTRSRIVLDSIEPNFISNFEYFGWETSFMGLPCMECRRKMLTTWRRNYFCCTTSPVTTETPAIYKPNVQSIRSKRPVPILYMNTWPVVG